MHKLIDIPKWRQQQPLLFHHNLSNPVMYQIKYSLQVFNLHENVYMCYVCCIPTNPASWCVRLFIHFLLQHKHPNLLPVSLNKIQLVFHINVITANCKICRTDVRRRCHLHPHFRIYIHTWTTKTVLYLPNAITELTLVRRFQVRNVRKLKIFSILRFRFDEGSSRFASS